MRKERDRREYMRAYYQRNKERYAKYYNKEAYIPSSQLSEEDLEIRRAINRKRYASQIEKRRKYMREYMRTHKKSAA